MSCGLLLSFLSLPTLLSLPQPSHSEPFYYVESIDPVSEYIISSYPYCSVFLLWHICFSSSFCTCFSLRGIFLISSFNQLPTHLTLLPVSISQKHHQLRNERPEKLSDDDLSTAHPTLVEFPQRRHALTFGAWRPKVLLVLKHPCESSTPNRQKWWQCKSLSGCWDFCPNNCESDRCRLELRLRWST